MGAKKTVAKKNKKIFCFEDLTFFQKATFAVIFVFPGSFGKGEERKRKKEREKRKEKRKKERKERKKRKERRHKEKKRERERGKRI